MGQVMDAVSEARLALVHPELTRRVRNFAQKCADNSIAIRVTQGLRTHDEQAALYAQGRTAPGNKVTNAPPGYSAHEYGYAVDIAPDKPDFPEWTPDWDASDVRWKQMLLLGRSCGLAEGATWRTFPDMPHFYMNELPADPDWDMRYSLSKGGVKAVWADWEGKLVNDQLEQA